MTRNDKSEASRADESVPPRWTAFALLLVIVVDQVTKCWAWREVPLAHINFGGNPLVGPVVGGWYADPATGALLDLAGSGSLAAAVLLLLRRRHPVLLLAPAALAIGGWTSNLLDRLGLHHLTAPGSVRGAIDFIPVGKYTFNVADFFIIGATVVSHWPTPPGGYAGSRPTFAARRCGCEPRRGSRQRPPRSGSWPR